ncbi:MAG TPA: hypothetical protein VF092_13270 [Longimicrobium sp.]
MAAVSDSPPLPWSGVLAWKLAGFLTKLVWQLSLAIITSIGAGLILLIGAYNVISFGSLGVSFVGALLQTAINLVFLFLLSFIVSFVALVAIIRALTYLSSRRIHFGQRWKLHLVLRQVRQGVRRMRAFARTQPRSEQLAAVARVVLVMTGVLMTVFLKSCDSESWNATLKVRLSMRAPVGRIGRSATSEQVSTLSDVSNYTKARRDKVATQIGAMTRLAIARGNHPLISRCGKASPLHPAEARRIAELYVDLTQAPPILKREYVLTEEQLTATLSLILSADSAALTVDCVELHPDYIQFFTTSVDSNGSRHNQALGMSVAKDAGNLRIAVDQLSIGRASFQLGWLGLGVTGGGGGLVRDAEGLESLAETLQAFDSRVFSIKVFEGYLRIVTWRLPSVFAARAAIDVGYVQQAVEHRVEPRNDADSLGVIRTGDVVYVLERTDEWLYVCSEVSGRLGWLPKAAFTSLESWPGQAQPQREAGPLLGRGLHRELGQRGDSAPDGDTTKAPQ